MHLQQPQKCGGAKTHKGRSPTGFLRTPKRRTGAEYIPFVRRWFSTIYYFNNIINKYILIFFN
jgi:hypothetical protein